MANEYVPRGHVKVILDAMALKNADLEWTGAELAELAGIHAKALPSTVKTAIRNGVLFSEKRGIKTFYSLTAYPQEEIELTPFNASLWADGDLVLYGVQETDDGGVLVTAEQLTKLKRLIAWSPLQ
jgi:hypothetical protein